MQTPALLVCVKCRQRLEKAGRFRQLSGLRQTLDTYLADGLRVLDVDCLDVCPDGGVTVCTPARAGSPAAINVVRSRADLAMVCDGTLQRDERRSGSAADVVASGAVGE